MPTIAVEPTFLCAVFAVEVKSCIYINKRLLLTLSMIQYTVAAYPIICIRKEEEIIDIMTGLVSIPEVCR
jgi:hypothetical protein